MAQSPTSNPESDQPKKTQFRINGKFLDLSFNVGRVMKGKTHGLDFDDLDESLATKIFMDTVLFAEVAFKIFDDRIEQVGLDEMAFYESLDGETLKLAMEAMKNGIRFFFPWGNQVIDQLEEVMDNLMEVGQTLIDRAASGPPSSSAPESQESSPST